MDELERRVADAEANLQRARRLLSGTGRYGSDDWMLLATLIGEADLVIREAHQRTPGLDLSLLDVVTDEFRKETDDFSDADFLQSSRAARRRNPQLFQRR
jgi:hypothetical protein